MTVTSLVISSGQALHFSVVVSGSLIDLLPCVTGESAIISQQPFMNGLEFFTPTFVPLRSDQDPKTASNGCNR